MHFVYISIYTGIAVDITIVPHLFSTQELIAEAEKRQREGKEEP